MSSGDVIRAVEKVSPIIEEVGTKLWQLSETSLTEVKSSKYLKDLLEKNDFKITSEGTSGVPTAFIAEFGSGKPVLGIMLEYDALPGLGNEVTCVVPVDSLPRRSYALYMARVLLQKMLKEKERGIRSWK